MEKKLKNKKEVCGIKNEDHVEDAKRIQVLKEPTIKVNAKIKFTVDCDSRRKYNHGKSIEADFCKFFFDRSAQTLINDMNHEKRYF